MIDIFLKIYCRVRNDQFARARALRAARTCAPQVLLML